MAAMEGLLMKWTNVMKGWQYRWCVLDDYAGLLSYYTTKEKMAKGARRGCVRLKGAIVSIDEDDCTFNINVDGKMFHFQAQDSVERDKWIRALEDTRLRHTQLLQKRWDPKLPVPTVEDFNKKLTETDAFLQIMIDQVKALDIRASKCEDVPSHEQIAGIRDKANTMLESIKHSIVLLQIAKNVAHPINGMYQPQSSDLVAKATKTILKKTTSVNTDDKCSPAKLIKSNDLHGLLFDDPNGLGSIGDFAASLIDEPIVGTAVPDVEPGIEVTEERSKMNLKGHKVAASKRQPKTCATQSSGLTSTTLAGDQNSNTRPQEVLDTLTPISSQSENIVTYLVPETSYSSSEDEDFFDASEYARPTEDASATDDGDDTTTTATASSQKVTHPSHASGRFSAVDPSTPSDPVPFMERTIDYDAMYEDDEEEDLGSVESHGSVISHLLSQVRLGMDLTKVVLPTFILERRSLLEMYGDFFAHPDLFVRIADLKDPQDRMVQVVRWYLSAFHAGRKSSVAKKPYNPILGEIFRCYWEVPEVTGSEDKVTEGPVPWASRRHLAFIAEQVSHHPPVSAVYAEHYDKRITLGAHTWTKSKFLGLSIGVLMIGQGCISVLDYDEEYIFNFPNGYGRSILTVPWIELGGSTSISCAKTGYSANIEFLTKPFYGGKKHRIAGEVFQPNAKKPFMTVAGEWNGVMHAKWVDTGKTEVFVDTTSIPITKKKVLTIAEQETYESRRLWKDVTAGLTYRNIEKATEAKFKLEQWQREEARVRKEKGIKWDTRVFHDVGGNWIYDRPLQKRLAAQTSVTTLAETQPA